MVHNVAIFRNRWNNWQNWHPSGLQPENLCYTDFVRQHRVPECPDCPVCSWWRVMAASYLPRVKFIATTGRCLLRCLIVRQPRFRNQLEICWWLVINNTNTISRLSHGGQGGQTQADEELGPLNRVILPPSCQTRHQVSFRRGTILFQRKTTKLHDFGVWPAP